MSNRSTKRQRLAKVPDRQPQSVTTPTPFEMVLAARQHLADVDEGAGQVLGAVEALAVRRREVESDLRHAVVAARVARQPWAAIGRALGTSGQAARMRYGSG
jgi:hypothetical protein